MFSESLVTRPTTVSRMKIASRPRKADFFLALALLLPFVVTLVRLLLEPSSFAIQGDRAIVDIDVRAAAHGHQLLGMYSRFEWNHPGPLYFYLLAPFIAAWDNPLSLSIGALVLNLLWTSLLVLMVRVWHGVDAAGAAGVAVLLACLTLGSSYLADPWPPYAMVLPMLVLLVSSASVVRTPSALPVMVLSGSMVAQTHVSGLPVFVVVALTAVTVGVVVHRHELRRLVVRGFVPALALLVVTWAVPLHEELRSGPGNITALWNYV